MVDQIKISIITVCYNAKDSIERTIQSVLGQTYDNVEYIIVDGGSSDGTTDIINKYKDKITCFISEKDNGIYDAMNKGIALATGDWIHFKNSGDLFVSPHTLVDVFSRAIDNDTQILHGNCIYTNDWGFLRMKPLIISPNYNNEMPVLHPACFIRANLHRSRKYNMLYKSSGDYEFMLYCVKNNIVFQYIDEDISIFPIGGFAMSNCSITASENQKILKTYFPNTPTLFLWIKRNVTILCCQITYVISKIDILKKIYVLYLKKKGWRELSN